MSLSYNKPVKETITIQVKVDIEYDNSSEYSNRESVLKRATENVLGVSTYGGNYMTKSKSAKVMKPRKKIKKPLDKI